MVFNLILFYLLICFQLHPFALMGVIMHNVYLLGRKNFDYVVSDPLVSMDSKYVD